MKDESTYNPCKTIANVYFYAHPTDPHQYYQCDEAGNVYSRTCGNLVWDTLITACNWESAVARPSVQRTLFMIVSIDCLICLLFDSVHYRYDHECYYHWNNDDDDHQNSVVEYHDTKFINECFGSVVVLSTDKSMRSEWRMY
jgi:hypothetical protein